MLCLPQLLVPQIFLPNICFSNPSVLFICPNDCSCVFLIVLSRDLSYPTISITSSFGISSVHDMLIILLISATLSLLTELFFGVQHSHPCRRMDHNVGFQSVDFGINSDISVGEDGHYLGLKTHSYSFLYKFWVTSGVWGYCEAQVFKCANLFYSFPFT